MRAPRLGEAYAHCERLARERDRDRWLGALFAPAAARPRLYALCAFFSETGRVKTLAREPLMGEARLTWWREAIAGERDAEAAGNPVAAALIDAIAAAGLSTKAFADYLEARRDELYAEPPATRQEIEARGRALFAPQFAFAARALDADGAEGAALSAGMAAALAEAGEAAAAFAHLNAAEAALAGRAASVPAFAPLATLRLDLNRRARGEGPAPAWRRQWAIWRWARRT